MRSAEHGGLAVEAQNAREDIGLRLKDASVVDEIPARQIVRRVDNNIVFSDHIHGVARVKPDRVRDHSDLRIDEHYQHRGALESPLPLGSHLGEDEVSAVALRLTSS